MKKSKLELIYLNIANFREFPTKITNHALKKYR